MKPRDDFKTTRLEHDSSRPPSIWSRVYVTLGTLVLSLVCGFAAAFLGVFLVFWATHNRYTNDLGLRIHVPGWVYITAICFGFGWAIRIWGHCLRDECATRKELELLREKASMIEHFSESPQIPSAEPQPEREARGASPFN